MLIIYKTIDFQNKLIKIIFKENSNECFNIALLAKMN